MNRLAVTLVLFLAWCSVASGAPDLLPARIDPDANFPRIREQAPSIEEVAPGVAYGEYQLATANGPIVVRVVAVQPQRSDVKVATVLANNRLESHGETVGSMAKRTAAVAGVNGDYYDIGNTNRPLNIVVRNGVLLQMPRKRYALAIARDGSMRIAEFSFYGQVQVGERTAALDAVDAMPPPEGGTSLITPEFGTVPPAENVTLVGLSPLDGVPPLSHYRVTSVLDNLHSQPPGYYLAIGPTAYNQLDVPSPGDVTVASGDLSPLGLDQIVAAIGGGPLILHEGAWYEDPDGPRGGEYDKRIPSTGAATTPDGRLLLFEIDGRQPSISVGLTRHEFSALMRAFGATEGLAFDGGGSSTMVVRRLGEADSSMVNSPSDGVERAVGDALLVYSTAPVGPPSRIVARPGTIRAVTGADVPVRVAAVDAAGHLAATDVPLTASVEPATLGIFRDGRFTALQPGDGKIVVRSGALAGKIAVEVQRSPARLSIAPAEPNVDRNGTLELQARGFDARGYRLAMPQLLAWSATDAAIDARGTLHAGTRNALVTLRVGDASASTKVTVGTHGVGLPFAERAHFMTIPHGGGGSVERDASCATCVALTYAFSGNERGAYAMADLPLPAGTVGVEFDVLDDGSDARLRVDVRNGINEQVLVDAATLDQPGWRHVVVRFPPEAAGAARLTAIYVLPPRGMELSNGQITLRNVRALVAGE